MEFKQAPFECTFALKHFNAINQDNKIETPIKLISSEGKEHHFNRNILAIYSSFVYWEVKENELLRVLKVNFADDTLDSLQWLFRCGVIIVFDSELSNNLFGLLLYLHVDLEYLEISNKSSNYTLPEYLEDLNVFEIEERDQDIPSEVEYNRGRKIHLELQKFWSEYKSDESAISNGFYCMFLHQLNCDNLHRSDLEYNLCYTGKFTYNSIEIEIKKIFKRPLSHFDQFIQYYFSQRGIGVEPYHKIYKRLTEKWIKKSDNNLKPVIFAQKNLGYAGEIVEGALYSLVFSMGRRKYFKYYVNSLFEMMIDDIELEHIFVDDESISDFAHYHLTNILCGRIVQEIKHVSYKHENMKPFTCSNSECNLLCLTVEDREMHEKVCEMNK